MRGSAPLQLLYRALDESGARVGSALEFAPALTEQQRVSLSIGLPSVLFCVDGELWEAASVVPLGAVSLEALHAYSYRHHSCSLSPRSVGLLSLVLMCRRTPALSPSAIRPRNILKLV